MGDTLPNIEIPNNEWIDLYSLASIPVGTAVSVENVGSCDIYLAVSATEPPADYDAYNILQRGNGVRLQNTEGDTGAWAFCNSTGAKINVLPLAETGFYPHSGVSLKTADGAQIDVQNPLPTNGDSVYLKDIDVSNSDNGDFSGVVTDYFDSLKTVNNDDSVTNPKTIKIWFNRTIQTSAIGFGCDDLTKSFSNIVIKALGSGEVVRFTKDLSADNTKYNSLVVDLPPLVLNGVIIEFHTADEIGLSNLIIYKSTDVNSRLSAISNVTGEVEDINSSRKALTISPYSDFRIEVARGNIPGTSFGFVSCLNRTIATAYETISPQGGLYPFPAAASIVNVTSTDANDAAAGTGARTVLITGLDTNYDEITETVTMAGLTPVATLKSFLRINSFIVTTAGTGQVNAGDIDITLGTDILGRIVAGEGLMKQMIYTVPAGFTIFNTNQVWGCGKDDEIEIQEFADIGGAGVFLGFGVIFIYAGSVNFTPQTFFPIIEKTDIDIRGLRAVGTTGRIAGFYEFLLIDNSVL